MNEQKAIEGCRRHDRISQKYVYDQYAERMLMVCLRYVRDLHDAEELLLNGFHSFFRTIDRFVFAGPGSAGALLRKIMVNECLMFLRRGGRLRIVAGEDATHVTVEDDALGHISVAEIFRMVMQLPEGYRTVFNLHAIEGYSHREIARMLDIAEGTSKSQLNKARAILQQLLKEKGSYYER